MAIAQRPQIVLSLVVLTTILLSGCCGPMGCGGCSTGPLMTIGARCGGGCSNCDGCGERYIDEWINHPPSCDQCDSCGNHNGQSCGECRPIFDGFKSLWGYRRDCGCDVGGCDSDCSSGCDGGSCGGGGCSSCGGGQDYVSDEMGHYSMHSSAAIPMPHQPSPAPRIVDAKPMLQPYLPQRTKQIFRPKGSVAGTAPRPSDY